MLASYTDRVFISGSSDVINMQIVAGIQKIWCNITLLKKAQNKQFLAQHVEVGGARSLSLKRLKIPHG